MAKIFLSLIIGAILGISVMTWVVYHPLSWWKDNSIPQVSDNIWIRSNYLTKCWLEGKKEPYTLHCNYANPIDNF